MPGELYLLSLIKRSEYRLVAPGEVAGVVVAAVVLAVLRPTLSSIVARAARLVAPCLSYEIDCPVYVGRAVPVFFARG